MISEAAMGEAWGRGPLWYSGKKEAHDAGGPSSSLKESISFLESPSRGRPEFDSFFLSIFGDRIRSSEAAMGGRRRAAPRFSWQ
jgi:hypothetical protein